MSHDLWTTVYTHSEYRIEDTQPRRRGHPWSETHVSLSRSRSRGARTKQGTCSTCSLSARSTLSIPLTIERFMNATGYTKLIESQCEISGRRLLSLSQHRIQSLWTQHRRPLRHHQCVFTVYFFLSFFVIFFFFFFFFFISPLGRKGEKRKWNVEGGRGEGLDLCLRGDSCLGPVHLPLKI